MQAPRYHRSHLPRYVGGFTLLEALLAIFVFSLAVVALVEAITQIGKTSLAARQELQIQSRLDSLLLEATRSPALARQVRLMETESKAIKEEEVTYTTEITPLALKNRTEQPLEDIFHVRIKANWLEGRDPQEHIAETWVYPHLYHRAE